MQQHGPPGSLTRESTTKEAAVACACEKDRGRGNKCAWCKEAIANGTPPARHNCSSFGKCS